MAVLKYILFYTQLSFSITLKIEDLLKMSLEAYNNGSNSVEGFNLLYSYGYNGNGYRAKVFKRNRTIVIASKGTTPFIHGISFGPTGEKDNLMDNLLFSRCEEEDKDCLYRKKIEIDTLGYLNSLEWLVRSITILFKGHKIVLTGHSMGGALSSLISSRLNVPTISFSSPGEKYILNVLQTLQDHQNVYHFGLCNDDLYFGSCGSFCTLMGYSINTTCHFGKAYCVTLKDKLFNFNGLYSHRGEYLLKGLTSFSKHLFKMECNSTNDLIYYSFYIPT